MQAAVRRSSRGANRTAAGSAAGGSASQARRAPSWPDRHLGRQKPCGSNRHPARCRARPAGCGARASHPSRPQPVRAHSHRRSCTLPPTRSSCPGWGAAPARPCAEPGSCGAHVCRSSARRGWSERAAAWRLPLRLRLLRLARGAERASGRTGGGRTARVASDMVMRENPASRGTEASAEVLVGPPWRMESNAGQQQ